MYELESLKFVFGEEVLLYGEFVYFRV